MSNEQAPSGSLACGYAVDKLTCQYDLKYWPSISEVAGAIGVNAEEAVTVARDPAAGATTESRRPGLAYFLKALKAKLDDIRVRRHGFIPNHFSLSDNPMASLVNCALDFEFDELIEGTFVKRFRQRERKKKAR
ncbi:hypothetical protein NHG95_28405 [Pseudomonas corrugata]|uniref:hypothetical protein n=1 Tax=Pseudomonas corrugata TaxID=47879 RepID=UPI0028C49622|nr:hypothetical protein [Pseudomonas corrugata]MDU9037057.1 hypothetical protein [Pseudomonas corrugata]